MTAGGQGATPAIESAAAFRTAFAVSRETAARFETYAALLKQWQKAVQLVAPSTLGSIWSRHFADSAQLAALAPRTAKVWLDLGSGAGLPGLVIAILATEPGSPLSGLRVVLIESDTRKAAFLREAARQTGCAVDILGTRIEINSTRDKVGAVDVISARALAPLTELFHLAHPYWQPTTLGLFLKGRDTEKEVEAARADWTFELELKPSLTDPSGRIACVRKLCARG